MLRREDAVDEGDDDDGSMMVMIILAGFACNLSLVVDSFAAAVHRLVKVQIHGRLKHTCRQPNAE